MIISDLCMILGRFWFLRNDQHSSIVYDDVTKSVAEIAAECKVDFCLQHCDFVSWRTELAKRKKYRITSEGFQEHHENIPDHKAVSSKYFDPITGNWVCIRQAYDTVWYETTHSLTTQPEVDKFYCPSAIKFRNDHYHPVWGTSPLFWLHHKFKGFITRTKEILSYCILNEDINGFILIIPNDPPMIIVGSLHDIHYRTRGYIDNDYSYCLEVIIADPIFYGYDNKCWRYNFSPAFLWSGKVNVKSILTIVKEGKVILAVRIRPFPEITISSFNLKYESPIFGLLIVDLDSRRSISFDDVNIGQIPSLFFSEELLELLEEQRMWRDVNPAVHEDMTYRELFHRIDFLIHRRP